MALVWRISIAMNIEVLVKWLSIYGDVDGLGEGVYHVLIAWVRL